MKKIFKDLKKETKLLEFLAGSFSAKESFAKALGLGMRDGLLFNNIEIIRDEFGQPYLNLQKELRFYYKNLKNLIIMIYPYPSHMIVKM